MEVLIDHATLALVAEDVEVEAVGSVPRKGAPGTVEAWRVVSVRQPDSIAASEQTAARTCPSCGSTTGRDDRHCASCGELIPAAFASRRAGARSPSYSRIHDRSRRRTRPRPRSPAVMQQLPRDEPHPRTPRRAIEKFIGDALMAVFGLPVRHEDDAVRAFVQPQRCGRPSPRSTKLTARYGVRLACPIGVNMGSVVAGGEHRPTTRHRRRRQRRRAVGTDRR
jgi:class 3 adenylate cyclase